MVRWGRRRTNSRNSGRGDPIDPRDIAYEVADALVYADILVRELGFTLEEVTVDKFNLKSAEIGSTIRLGSEAGGLAHQLIEPFPKAHEARDRMVSEALEREAGALGVSVEDMLRLSWRLAVMWEAAAELDGKHVRLVSDSRLERQYETTAAEPRGCTIRCKCLPCAVGDCGHCENDDAHSLAEGRNG